MNLRYVGDTPVGCHVFDHVGLLSEGPVTDGADEGLLASVDLQMLLEVETLGVDEEATNWAALVLGPVVVHVKVEVVEITEKHVAFDTIQRPDFVLDLTLVGRHVPLDFLPLLLLLVGESGVCGRIGNGGGDEGCAIGEPLYFCMRSIFSISSTCCIVAIGPITSAFFFQRLAMVNGRAKSGKAG